MKKINILLILIIFCICFSACTDNSLKMENNEQIKNNQSQEEVNKDTSKENEDVINEDYDVNKEFEGIIENTRLSSVEMPENYKVVSVIDFGDLAGVTYEHIEEITEDSITEVWLIKMGNLNQYNKIVKKLNDSLEELKIKYADNKLITAILTNKDNIIIKQKEGIVMAAFAGDAGAIISGIEQSFNEEPEVIVEEQIEEIVSGDVFEESISEMSGELKA